MDVTRQALAEHFQLLNDDALLAEFQSTELTEAAKAVAAEELRRRGIELPGIPDELLETSEPAPEADDADLVIVDRVSTPAEAHMLRSRLELEGIPAAVVDENMAHTLPSLVVGGVRVLVPESYLDRAHEIAEAIKRGDFALDC